MYVMLCRGEQKNQKNRLNRENQKKNNRKNRIVKKNRLEFLKNQPVRFGLGFISLKLENRTESNRTQTKKKKPSQIGKNRAGRFEPVLVFFGKNWFLLFFFYKNQTEPKIITPNVMYKIICILCFEHNE